jgi:hypothetical protein
MKEKRPGHEVVSAWLFEHLEMLKPDATARTLPDNFLIRIYTGMLIEMIIPEEAVPEMARKIETFLRDIISPKINKKFLFALLEDLKSR